MKSKIAICLIGCLLFFTAISQAAPKLRAQSAVLVDAKTGQVLFDKDMQKKRAPASTTKILTAIIAVESGKLDDIVTVSTRAAATPGSSMHLFAGQSLSLRELVTGLMLRSGNDAAVAIAEHLAGSVENFVIIMNQKAQLIGAYNSHFVNPHGLSKPGHYSTAFDLAWITRYALANPIFADIVNKKETSIEWLDRKGREHDSNIRNTNRLLWMLEEADGVKTGTTSEAGPCLVSSATRADQKLIAVVLNAPDRWYDSMRLLTYGFDKFDLYFYAEQGEILGTVPLAHGISDILAVCAATTAALVVPTEDYGQVNAEVDLPDIVKAPVYEGQKIGEIVFYVDNKAVKTVDLVSTADVQEKTISRIFFNNFIESLRLLSGWGLL